jgi:transcriptional regulator
MNRKLDLRQGMLDLLVLQILLGGPAHGNAIAECVRKMSEEVLQVERGSVCMVLHRLEEKGWLEASWALSDKGKRARYYELTRHGHEQLASERSKWDALARAIGLILTSNKPS